mmetsp:Transcript_26420/g.70625  ORF Transcript_26420/g.70625 Transcript_26420/m.70625 type:complete len:88 (-) Transcript_26420:85-348(-)
MSRLKSVDNGQVDLQLARERQDQVLELNESCRVLNELFKDMADIVQEQQEGIDQIEKNVTAAAARTKDAVVHLEEASDHQKKSCTIS